MSDWSDPDDVLSTSALPDEVVEGLLDGTLAPEEAPLGYADVASLLHAARGAPATAEMAGADAAVAALVAGVRIADAQGPDTSDDADTAELAEVAALVPGGTDELSTRRRRRALGRPAKVVIAGVVVATTLGGVAAAATGHLSIPGVTSDPTTTSVPNTDGGAGVGDAGRDDAEPARGRRSATSVAPDPSAPPAVVPGAGPDTVPGPAGSPGAAASGDASPGRSGAANPGAGQSGTGAAASEAKGGNGAANGNGRSGSAGGNATNGNGTTPTTPPAAEGNGQGAVNGQGSGAANGVGTANAPTDPGSRSGRP